MAVSPEQKAAQRRLSRELKAGTFKPSVIGAKSRQVTTFRRDQLLSDIMSDKRIKYGSSPKWNETRALRAVTHNPKTGVLRTTGDLATIGQAFASGDFSELDVEDKSALYYH